jgi:hypothetical protein
VNVVAGDVEISQRSETVGSGEELCNHAQVIERDLGLKKHRDSDQHDAMKTVAQSKHYLYTLLPFLRLEETEEHGK